MAEVRTGAGSAIPTSRKAKPWEKRHAVRAGSDRTTIVSPRSHSTSTTIYGTIPYARCVEANTTTRRSTSSAQAISPPPTSTSPSSANVNPHPIRPRHLLRPLLLHIGAFEIKMLPDLIALLRRRGFTFTTLPEAMKDPAYSDGHDIALSSTAEHSRSRSPQPVIIRFPPNSKPTKELEATCRPNRSKFLSTS